MIKFYIYNFNKNSFFSKLKLYFPSSGKDKFETDEFEQIFECFHVEKLSHS